MADYSRNHSDKNRGGYKKNKDGNSSGGNRSYGGDRRDRNDRNDRGGFGGRRNDGDRSYGDRRNDRGFERREDRVDDRDFRGGFGKRRSNNDGTSRNDRNERGGFGGRRNDGERSYGDRNNRRDDRGGFGGRRNDGERSYGDRDRRRDGERSFRDDRGPKKFDRNNRGDRSFDRKGEGRDGERNFRDNRRDDRGPKRFDDRGPKKFDRNDRNDRRDGRDFNRGPRQDFKRDDTAQNPTGGYRPSKNSPDIDTDVTGKELENWTLRALRQLEAQNADTVAKHLVMVGRYLDLDPAFALEHALAASKRAGRIGLVREVVGIAAYAAEDFELALRELRTHRRISGSNDHLALLVDCERALDRTEKALLLAEEAKSEEVAAGVRAEVAIVVSGIHRDAGQLKKAIAALEIPELNSKRGFDYSPRLFSAYAELLEADGQKAEARRWARLAVVTEAALGQGAFAEPEIFDIFTEEDLFEPEEVSVDLEAVAAAEGTESEEDEPSVEDEVAELLGEGTEADADTEDSEEPAEGETEQVEGLQEETLFDGFDELPSSETVVSAEQAEEDALFEVEADDTRG